jgi:tRNA-Thr(GGU) m(6)t(6)A37 methyltransferase TsaA
MKTLPIGIIHSPFREKGKPPIQPLFSKVTGRVEVYKKYSRGLRDITGFSHIILIYEFHRSKGYELLVRPFLDNKLHGLFATRYPRRPNQIGLSVVRLLRRKGRVLFVKGIDVLDGTPLLDIKPYVPDFSATKKGIFKKGWLAKKVKGK